jgi:hypothetical protein
MNLSSLPVKKTGKVAKTGLTDSSGKAEIRDKKRHHLK